MVTPDGEAGALALVIAFEHLAAISAASAVFEHLTKIIVRAIAGVNGGEVAER